MVLSRGFRNFRYLQPEGTLHFFHLLIFLKNYTVLLSWKLFLMASGFVLSWKQCLNSSVWKEKKKVHGMWILDYLSKAVSFFLSPVCEVCLSATSVTSVDSDRVVREWYLLSFLYFLTPDWLLFPF